jgi:imidazolonepropionase-like amidohydrolase
MPRPTLAALALTSILTSITSAQPAPAPSTSGGGGDRYTILRCAHLIADARQPTRDNVTLIAKNGKVDSIIEGLDAPLPAAITEAKSKGATVTEQDLKQHWVLPGLIDCHVHLSMVIDAESRLRRFTESDELTTLRAARNARTTLLAGFTTVRDLGAEPSVIFALRDAINEGIAIGPRIIAAGHAVSITGGHGDPTTGARADLFSDPKNLESVADGPDACAKAVRQQVKLGADVIKLTATGGVLSPVNTGTGQHFTDAELKSIIDTAHSLGRKAAAHAHGTDGINAALRAGVDSIDHGTYLDDESIKLFKQTGAYHVPTMLAGATVARNANIPGYYPRMVVPKALAVGPKIKDAVKKSHEAGVKIAFGTDAGVFPHGINAQEFTLMVDAGMTPKEALIAATINAADLLGLSSEIGTLEPGKAADLIAVDADPMKDVKTLESVRVVVKGGEVVN